MPYYGTRLSENIAIRNPEGYLICQNVPLARTGTQEYAPVEIGLSGTNMITVYRTPEEVFSPATIASFEGLPVANNHPPEDVNANNVSVYQRGHVQNVRRGEGDQSDLLLGDLLITHPDLIDAIQKGKREVSCGYQCNWVTEDGKVYQRAIRGNHVAVVDQGRAGPRVAIKDQSPAQGIERSTPMSKPNPNGILGKILKSFARDAEPEDVEVAGQLLYGSAKDACGTMKNDAEPAAVAPASPAPALVVAPAPAPVDPTPPKDEDPIAVLTQAVTALTGKVEALSAMVQGGTKPADEDPLAQLEKEVSCTSPTTIEGNLIDPEKMVDQPAPAPAGETKEDPKPAPDASAVKAAIDAIKPIIAKLPADQRRAASDAAAKQLRTAYGMSATPSAKDNAYLAVQRAVSVGKDPKPSAHDESQLGERVMAQRNANMRQQQPSK